MKRFLVFVISLSFPLHLRAADVRFFGFSKGELYVQSGIGAPVLASGSPYEFRAFGLLTVTNLTTASIKLPSNGATKTLTNYPGFLERRELFNSSANLNFGNPNGTYTFTVQGPQSGTKTVSLTLSSDFYPSVPHISNYAAAQAINPAADFVLRWDNPLTTEFVQVKVFDGPTLVFQSPDSPASAGALTGQSNAVVIPKVLLSQGKSYKGQITAWHRISGDSTGYPGALSYAAYVKQTEFGLKTSWNVTDVNWFGIAKTIHYVQTSALPPTTASGNAYEFSAFSETTAAGNVTAVGLQTPARLAKALTALANTSWSFSEKFASQAALDAAYGNGVYELSLLTLHNGLQKPPLALSSMTVPAPQINNWNDVNRIDSTKSFTLSWNALGGTTNDFVKVTIRKAGQIVFQTGNHPRTVNALNGTSRSVVVPVGLLQAGETCDCSILYLKAVNIDTFSYPLALGFAASGAETSATLRSRGGNIRTPVLSGIAFDTTNIQFAIDADPGRLYVIQGSSDLLNWSDLIITNAPSNPFIFRFKPSAQQSSLMFRIYAE
jgi:hypothetical protein